jgi:hypothetical protein
MISAYDAIDWGHALCRGKAPEDGAREPHRFYPEDNWDMGGALEICRVCPIRVECGEYAMKHELHGTWGGLTAGRRTKIRREQRKAAAAAEWAS